MELSNLTAQDLVKLYNASAASLGKPLVKCFNTKAIAITRVEAIQAEVAGKPASDDGFHPDVVLVEAQEEASADAGDVLADEQATIETAGMASSLVDTGKRRKSTAASTNWDESEWQARARQRGWKSVPLFKQYRACKTAMRQPGADLVALKAKVTALKKEDNVA